MEALADLDPRSARWAERRRIWTAPKGLEIITDSQAAAAWFRPGGRVQGQRPAERMADAWDVVEELSTGGWEPRVPDADWARWVPRSLTAGPDLLANMSMDLQRPLVWLSPTSSQAQATQHRRLRVVGDGAARANEPRSVFAVIILAYEEDGSMTPVAFYSKF